MKILKMSAQKKLFFLSFDEMSIKWGLHYNQYLDWIIGYECFGVNNNQSNKFATIALVFMIMGLTKKWKQAIGYFFSSNLLLCIY